MAAVTSTVTGFANVTVTGVSGTGSIGSTTITGDANVSVTGVSATGEIGELEQPWGLIIPSQTSNFTGISPSQTPSWTDIAA